MDTAELEALATLSAPVLESAEFGAVVVDRTGIVERYNASESKLSHLSPARVIGKSFFHHVAPCTGVRAFEGRFIDFIASGETVSHGFTYFFPFSHGASDVFVSFVKLAASESILIVVERIDPPLIQSATA